jgi:hypothetical protein
MKYVMIYGGSLPEGTPIASGETTQDGVPMLVGTLYRYDIKDNKFVYYSVGETEAAWVRLTWAGGWQAVQIAECNIRLSMRSTFAETEMEIRS